MARCTSAGGQIQIRGGLLQDQKGGLNQLGTRQAQELALPGGQRVAAGGDLRQIAVRRPAMKACAPTARAARSTSRSLASGRA
jgi:hypothetical protein